MGMRIAAVLAFTVLATAAVIAYASRNSSGTMAAANGPYTPGTVISSSIVNARFSDIEAEITDSLSRSGKGGMTAALRGIDGTVAAPAHSFTSETNSGLYRIGASDLGMSIAGVKTHEWTATGEVVTGTLGVGAVTTPTATVHAGRSDGNYQYKIERTGGTDPKVYGIGISGTAGSPSLLIDDVSVGATRITIASSGAVNVAGTLTSTGAFTASSTAALTGGASIGASGTAISASFRNTISWTPGSLGPGICTSTSLTITGAVGATECQYGIPGAPVDGLVPMCWVTTNTCTLKWCYTGATSATPPSGTYACRAMNP